jgi:YegS/Rv2252/BmrU family lipid kinase
MKTLFIFNPCSGRNRLRPWLAGAIRDFIAAHALDATFAVTEGRGHATELARAAVAAGCTVVAAVGGDGTMNEVAQGVVDTPAALALVPCGSGNGLALHLGLPRSPLEALRLVAGDRSRIAAVDTGVVEGRPFFNAMGFGLDADVSQRFNRLERRGLPAYAREAIAALRELKPQRCTVRSGDRVHALDAILVAVANSDQYGNNARIAPGARVDDGQLDLIAVRPLGFFGAAALASRLFLGGFDRSAHVLRLGGSRFTIERPVAGLVHTDGETHTAPARIQVEVRPQSLRLVVPALSRAVAFPRARPFGPLAQPST